MSKTKQKEIPAAPKENKFIFWGVLASFLVCVFLASSFKVMGDDDFFWHLATGRFIVENHFVPDKDVFGFATQGVEWIPFEWGWDVLSFLLYSAGGYNAVLIFRSLLFCWIFLLYYSLLKKLSLNPALNFILLFVLLLGMLDRLSARPHMFTYLFIVLLLYLLFTYRYIDRERYFKRLYIIPLILLIWCNIHMGVFVGGMILFLFFAAEAAAFKYAKKSRKDGLKPPSKEHLKKLFVISVISFFVLIINPHGINTYLYAYSHTKLKMLESITEWQNPFTGKIDLNFIVTIYKVLLFSSALILFYAYQKKDLFFALIASAFVIYSVRAIRFTVDYEIVIIAFLAISFNYYLNKIFNKRNIFYRGAFLNSAGIVLAVLFLFVSYQTYTGKIYEKINYYRVSGFGIDETYMPAQLFNFLSENNITGTPFNHFETGGYLVWKFPGQKNFIDSRNLSDNIFSEYSSILYMKPGFEKKLEQYGIDYIIYFNPEMTVKTNDLKNHIPAYSSGSEIWKLVYWDDKSMLFLKNIEKFIGLINKYHYKSLNPYNFYLNNGEFQNAVKNDPNHTKAEIERKLSSDPKGYFFYYMNQAAVKLLP